MLKVKQQRHDSHDVSRHGSSGGERHCEKPKGAHAAAPTTVRVPCNINASLDTCDSSARRATNLDVTHTAHRLTYRDNRHIKPRAAYPYRTGHSQCSGKGGALPSRSGRRRRASATLAASVPATMPVVQHDWKLWPPVTPSTSSSSPASARGSHCAKASIRQGRLTMCQSGCARGCVGGESREAEAGLRRIARARALTAYASSRRLTTRRLAGGEGQ